MLVVGLKKQFTRGFGQGGAITPVSNVADTRTVTGSRFSTIYSHSLTTYLNFRLLSEGDYAEVWDLIETKSGIPVLSLLNPDHPDLYRQMIYGDVSLESEVSLPYYNRYRFTLRINEFA